MSRSKDPLLNPKLQERIEKYEIPKPPYATTFDRILVFQINTTEEETFRGSSIIKADVTKDRDRKVSPRGVLISAGLKAREHLQSHGYRIGDIVWFAKHSYFGHEVDTGGGRHKWFTTLRSSELCGSEDLAERIRAGEDSVVFVDGEWRMSSDPGSGRVDHQFSVDEI